MASRKEIKQLIKEAEDQGWVVSLTNGDHFKWLSPRGGVFFSAQTPSDWRAVKNVERDLKNHGFIRIVKKDKRRK